VDAAWLRPRNRTVGGRRIHLSSCQAECEGRADYNPDLIRQGRLCAARICVLRLGMMEAFMAARLFRRPEVVAGK
jgi:hypothetical protein